MFLIAFGDGGEREHEHETDCLSRSFVRASLAKRVAHAWGEFISSTHTPSVWMNKAGSYETTTTKHNTLNAFSRPAGLAL